MILFTLTLRKVGDRNNKESDVVRWMNECHLLLVLYGLLLSNLFRGLLEEFKFEHGPRDEEQSGGVSPVRLMDRLFGGRYCILWAACWTMAGFEEYGAQRCAVMDRHDMGLQKVKIKNQSEGLPFVISLEDQLKAAIKRGATVVVQGKGRTFDLMGRTGRWEKPVSS